MWRLVRSSAALARGTPEQVTTLENPGLDGRSADVAGHPLAPVDVDLTPVVVDPRIPPHRPGLVLRPDGVDPARLDAVLHQVDEVTPDSVPAPTRDLHTRCQRVEAGTEQRLRTVDVADAGEHRLVHQQRS